MVRMTKELDEALRRWAAAHEGIVGGLIDDRPVYVAYRAAQEAETAWCCGFMGSNRCCKERAEPEPRFRVGGRVRVSMPQARVTTESEGRIIGYWVEMVDGEDAHYAAETLSLIPDLPPDHLDRFWRVGAWIVHPGQTFIVLDEHEALEIQPSERAYPKHGRGRLREWGAGWSFHPDSPIKEEVEL